MLRALLQHVDGTWSKYMFEVNNCVDTIIVNGEPHDKLWFISYNDTDTSLMSQSDIELLLKLMD